MEFGDQKDETMSNPNADLAGRIRNGRLVAFLRRDLFTVQLDDGVTITAVMPEEWFSPWRTHRWRSPSR
jgi:hypothetical protein